MTTTPIPSMQAAMRLRELVFGAAGAAALRAAARLGVADALGETPATAKELAAAVNSDPRSLDRLMRALTCYGVFAMTEDDRYTHTEMSRLLAEDTPDSLRYITLWCTEPWTWDAWPRLDEAVRAGTHVFHDLYGKDFFDYLHDDAIESARVFDKAMTQSSMQSALDIAEFLDLTGVSTVVDIGGGQGHVLAGLLEKYPTLRGSLLDLPKVVANADPRLRDGGPLAPRVHLVPGDCRDKVPVHADMYVIKNVLEWDDDSTRRTLNNVVAAARPGARVVVIENLVDDSPSMKFTTAMDLLLLLNVGGRKHSKESLITRMTQAGLLVGDVRPVNAYLHAFDSMVPPDNDH
ncbi:acetylserotonin O-methyltransferase [Wenjunlia tyrosinilytica]|uniref:O-methyltransferase n=1 Tax=Wenjunlia tyrosinilytica TaxID=1544741 RepID=A0A917ZRN8_9ACTN|nr:acetylserotonin O-methyltransferase [Wenjunlia tyrosinilytica]GGO89901.1 O-methyltransferase [Wenjunlia tyrosinilytica]